MELREIVFKHLNRWRVNSKTIRIPHNRVGNSIDVIEEVVIRLFGDDAKGLGHKWFNINTKYKTHIQWNGTETWHLNNKLHRSGLRPAVKTNWYAMHFLHGVSYDVDIKREEIQRQNENSRLYSTKKRARKR